jgi:hypothetical protein
MSKPIRQTYYTAKCEPASGHPWLAYQFIRDRAKDVREDFPRGAGTTWKQMRKEGWKVVRVHLTEAKP